MAYSSIPQCIKDRFTQRMTAPINPDSCWEWQFSLNNYGYGVLYYKANGVRMRVMTHRVSWEVHNGPIPDGMFVLHHCDNPRCCNPHHLYLGTQRENMRDRMVRQRGNQPRGVRHPRATLTREQVEEMRRLYYSEGVSQFVIARQFGVHQSCVSLIVRGLAYTDVPMPATFHADNRACGSRKRVAR